MIQHLYIVIFAFALTACNQNRTATPAGIPLDSSITKQNSIATVKADEQEYITKRPSFKNVSDVVSGRISSTWVEIKDSSASLALHFRYKDTLAVSYSPECWLMYPYKMEGDKIVVYWGNYIDTKYDFDIVKAVNKTDKKYIGKPFMVLEIANDTTLKATYLIKSLIRKINSSTKERTFFPDKFILAPDGYI